MATNAGLNSARNKLDGLLRELIEKPDESADGDPLHGLDSFSASMPPPSTPTKRSSSAKGPRKRRKKDLTYDGDGTDGSRTHASYILKLFDRSVDFAPFNEDTPLYTLAKEWMENKPYRQRVSSEITDMEGDGSQDTVSSSPLDSENDGQYVSSLPTPSQIKSELKFPRIPEPPPRTEPGLDTVPEEPVCTVSELKNNHLQRWKKIKKSWRVASAINQTPYKESIKKLRELYQH
ncbi:predicted protein [Nematostella vectensis]|uniref:Protein lin-37 homolog n=1 Tax=Nematostella vectensis TaxID=45351 RepID=A7RFP4_NEMVE|nr:protein lin-37 homolog [Nematostella vectensis]EDO49757.1 predicted protein [Nematostella vectensis]|eukprot:XP_001641820.1 predicted protein [Nematostella vectensis]